MELRARLCEPTVIPSGMSVANPVEEEKMASRALLSLSPRQLSMLSGVDTAPTRKEAWVRARAAAEADVPLRLVARALDVSLVHVAKTSKTEKWNTRRRKALTRAKEEGHIPKPRREKREVGERKERPSPIREVTLSEALRMRLVKTGEALGGPEAEVLRSAGGKGAALAETLRRLTELRAGSDTLMRMELAEALTLGANSPEGEAAMEGMKGWFTLRMLESLASKMEEVDLVPVRTLADVERLFNMVRSALGVEEQGAGKGGMVQVNVLGGKGVNEVREMGKVVEV